MKFLVTGSTGLIGLQVVKDLIKENHTVYSGYHNTEPETGIPVHIELSNLDSIQKIIQEIKPDAVIHLAAMTNVDSCEDQRINILSCVEVEPIVVSVPKQITCLSSPDTNINTKPIKTIATTPIPAKMKLVACCFCCLCT